jgi:hypothetical protein
VSVRLDSPGRTHGHKSTYNAGCRCWRCTKANRVNRRPYAKAEILALRRLRELHESEYQRLYTEEASALGIRVGQRGRPKSGAA